MGGKGNYHVQRKVIHPFAEHYQYSEEGVGRQIEQLKGEENIAKGGTAGEEQLKDGDVLPEKSAQKKGGVLLVNRFSNLTSVPADVAVHVDNAHKALGAHQNEDVDEGVGEDVIN